LKVWKNSSWKTLLALEELHVVDQEQVVVAVALLKPSIRLSRSD
jgi:hypothetical protein